MKRSKDFRRVLREENLRNISYVKIPLIKKLTEEEIKQQEEQKEESRRLDVARLSKSLSGFRNNPTFSKIKQTPNQENITQLCQKINPQELQEFEEINGFNLAFLVARFGRLSDLEILINKGCDLNYQDHYQFSLLSHATNRKFDKETKKITEFLVSQENLPFVVVKKTLENFAQSNEKMQLYLSQ